MEAVISERWNGTANGKASKSKPLISHPIKRCSSFPILCNREKMDKKMTLNLRRVGKSSKG